MNYIYGDASKAPFLVDYIALLRHSLDFAVEHLLSEQRRHGLGTRTLGLRSAADGETRRLEELGRTVAKAMEGATVGAEGSPAALCAKAIVAAANEQVRLAVEGVRAQLSKDLGQLANEEKGEREKSAAALSHLLERQDLPDTSFSIKLTQAGGTHYVGRVATTSAMGLDAVIELDVPRDSKSGLGGVARVERFAPGLELHAPEVGGWFSKETRFKPQKVEKLFVVELSVGEGGSYKLRTGPDGTGAGWDVSVDASRKVQFVHLNERGETTQVEPHEGDGPKALALFDKLSAAASEARFHRTKVLEATLDGDVFVSHEEPTVLVERLVDEMAPVVQEIARRSKSSDELVIKRITGDSRREEIFISKAELIEKLAPLPANLRELFAPLGLESEKPSTRPPPEPKLPSRMPPPIPSVDGVATTKSGEDGASAAPAADAPAPAAKTDDIEKVADTDVASVPPSLPPPKAAAPPAMPNNKGGGKGASSKSGKA